MERAGSTAPCDLNRCCAYGRVRQDQRRICTSTLPSCHARQRQRLLRTLEPDRTILPSPPPGDRVRRKVRGASTGASHAPLPLVPLAFIGDGDSPQHSAPRWMVWTGACIPGCMVQRDRNQPCCCACCGEPDAALHSTAALQDGAATLKTEAPGYAVIAGEPHTPAPDQDR